MNSVLDKPKWSEDGVPLNEAAFAQDQWVDMTCCEECRKAFANYFGKGLPLGIEWCCQCQRYECLKCQHEEI